MHLSISVEAFQETLRKRRNLEKPIEDHRRVKRLRQSFESFEYLKLRIHLQDSYSLPTAEKQIKAAGD